MTQQLQPVVRFKPLGVPQSPEYQEAFNYMMHVKKTMVERGALEKFDEFAELLTGCHSGR